MGNWFIALDDPRPFYPTVRIVDRIEREVVGAPRDGVGWFMCLGMLGVVADSTRERGGAAFNYQFQAWRSRVTVTIETSRSPAAAHLCSLDDCNRLHLDGDVPTLPYLPDTVQPLVAGPLAVSADVRHPEPPLRGSVDDPAIRDRRSGEQRHAIRVDVPRRGGVHSRCAEHQGGRCRGHDLAVVDATVDVPNATVMFGPDFQSLHGEECERNRRELKLVEEASRLERAWYPPDVFAGRCGERIRTDQPAAVAAVESLFARHGTDAFTPLLAPSLMTERT